MYRDWGDLELEDKSRLFEIARRLGLDPTDERVTAVLVEWFDYGVEVGLRTTKDETVACARGHEHPLASVPEDESCPTCQTWTVSAVIDACGAHRFGAADVPCFRVDLNPLRVPPLCKKHHAVSLENQKAMSSIRDEGGER